MRTREEKAAYDKAYRAANREKVIAYSKAYYQTNRVRMLANQNTYNEANKEERTAYNKAYSQANKEKVIARKAKYREANLERKKAHDAVSNAIKGGKLVRLPCSECGEAKTEAHHYAYDMPLDVIWLCKKHHAQLHKEHREYEQLPQ